MPTALLATGIAWRGRAVGALATAPFQGRRVSRFAIFERAALRKLEQLDLATIIDDMRVPPGNRLEPLKGERFGHWSVRLNDQWRWCFRYEHGDALDVEIVDHHQRGDDHAP